MNFRDYFSDFWHDILRVTVICESVRESVIEGKGDIKWYYEFKKKINTLIIAFSGLCPDGWSYYKVFKDEENKISK